MFNGVFFLVAVATVAFLTVALLKYIFKDKKKEVASDCKNDTSSLKEYPFRYNNIKDD